MIAVPALVLVGLVQKDLGTALVMAFSQRDWMAIQNLVLLYDIVFTFVNLAIDVTYASRHVHLPDGALGADRLVLIGARPGHPRSTTRTLDRLELIRVAG